MAQKVKVGNIKIGDESCDWIAITDSFTETIFRPKRNKDCVFHFVLTKCKKCGTEKKHCKYYFLKQKLRGCLNCYRKEVTINQEPTDNNLKKCNSCKETKEITEFHKQVGGIKDVGKYCKNCVYYQVIFKTYKITKEELHNILNLQNYKCCICDVKLIKPSEAKTKDDNCNVMNVDHCHSTKKIRGILCARCNKALGMFDDNENIIRKAAEYIIKNKEVD